MLALAVGRDTDLSLSYWEGKSLQGHIISIDIAIVYFLFRNADREASYPASDVESSDGALDPRVSYHVLSYNNKTFCRSDMYNIRDIFFCIIQTDL